MDFNNLIFQWYYITDSRTGYKTLTLTTAIDHIYFGVYDCGQKGETAQPAGYNLTSTLDYFRKTTINICFRGGDNNLYMAPGFVLIIGS